MKAIHQSNRYTLIEILVAVAVLLIMMSFLFRFVISAQRVYTATSARSFQFDQAQTVFDLLNNDLNQAVVGTDDAYLGEDGKKQCCLYMLTRPLCGNMDGSLFVFFVNEEEKAEEQGRLKVVVYWHNQKTAGTEYNQLYRFEGVIPSGKYYLTEANRETVKNFTITAFSPYFTGVIAYLTGINLDVDMAKNDDYLVAEGIEEFSVAGSDLENGTAERPPYIRVSLKTGIPEELRGDRGVEEELKRSFSKIFFFN